MLRVFKPTSPMSVGSWMLAGYGPAAGVGRAQRPHRTRAAHRRAAATARPPCSGPGSRPTRPCSCRRHRGARVARRAPLCRSCSRRRRRHPPPAWALVAAPSGESGPARRIAAVASLAEELSLEAMTRSMGERRARVPRGQGRQAAARGQGWHRGRRRRRGPVRQPTAGRRRRRRRPADRLGAHPVRHLPCRHRVGRRPARHDRPAAGTARRTRTSPLSLPAAGAGPTPPARCGSRGGRRGRSPRHEQSDVVGALPRWRGAPARADAGSSPTSKGAPIASARATASSSRAIAVS